MATEKRLIDAYAFDGEICKMFVPYGDGTHPGDYAAMIHDETLVDVLEALNEAPTVEAVEVVRCYKCLHWDDHNNGYGYCKHPHWRYAWEYDALTEHCDFCSYGERREGE